MYPVGVLFGLGEPTKNLQVNEFACEFKLIISGFDTASSIALLAVSALAKKGPNGMSIPNSQIIIFPVIGLSQWRIDEESLISSSFFFFVQSFFSQQG